MDWNMATKPSCNGGRAATKAACTALTKMGKTAMVACDAKMKNVAMEWAVAPIELDIPCRRSLVLWFSERRRLFCEDPRAAGLGSSSNTVEPLTECATASFSLPIRATRTLTMDRV